jgi:hypothetical protein
MILALLLQTAVPPAPPATPTPVGAAQATATMVVEPVAMAVAGWDANGDGRSTRAEIDAGVARSLPAPTGYLGFADWAERWLGDRNALPSPFDVDTDSDNRITPAELAAAFGRAIARLDRDKDGVLARSELLTIRAQVNGQERPRRR